MTAPTLEEVRRRLRPALTDLPGVVGDWAAGRGLLGDVPLLDPGALAPRRFEELRGHVRVAATGRDLVTLAGLLEVPTGGLLLTVVAVGPEELGRHADQAAARARLAAVGAAADGIQAEVVAFLGALRQDGPVGAVALTRPLVFADPASFPHPDDPLTYAPDTVAAAEAAAADDRELLTDLSGDDLVPLPAEHARVWSPLFSVARTATIGLAAAQAGD